MAKTTPAKYIREKVRELREVTLPGGNRAFQRVGRSASIDIDRLAKIPAFPAAIISQLGGELSETNDEIWTKRMGITIVLQSKSDPFLDAVADKMDEYTELLIDALQSSRTDDAIICVYQSEDSSVPKDGMTDLLMKTLIFEYTIDRVI